MIDEAIIIRVRKFFLRSFIILSSRLLAILFSEGVALNYNGLAIGSNAITRRNGFFAFSIAIPVISRDYRWKLHGYLAARGRYDRYDRASGRETCSRVTYRPLRSKRAPPSRLLSRLSMLARIRLLFRSRAADRFKRVLYGVHGGRP